MAKSNLSYPTVGGSTSAAFVFVFLLFLVWLSSSKKLAVIKAILANPTPNTSSGSSSTSDATIVPDNSTSTGTLPAPSGPQNPNSPPVTIGANALPSFFPNQGSSTNTDYTLL